MKELITEHYKMSRDKLVRGISRYTANYQQAEDILQDAFIVAYNKGHLYDPLKGKVSSWFNRILYNTLWTTLKKKTISMVNENVLDELEEPDFSELWGKIESVRQCISTVKIEQHRTVLDLFYIKGYRIKDIESITCLNPATIKSICRRFRLSAIKTLE